MTQFIVFTGPKPDLSNYKDLYMVPLQEDVIVNYVGTAISEKNKSKSWVLRGRNGEPGHELCDNAIMEIQEHKNIKLTELGKLLIAYMPLATAITFFYATDSENLTIYNDSDKFINYVSECLSGKGETSLEIYAIYNKNS